MIKREVVDEIIARNDIESLISSYVSLKRAGSNLKGLCPFHSEKTPSFTVYPGDNSFYCFGCGIGGNAITFVRQIEHLDYTDSIEFLAKRAGITVMLDDEEEKTKKNYISKQRLYEMNRDAARFFHYSLFADNPKAKAALSYFVDKRKLSIATIKHFGLGFAPDSYDSLINYMLGKGYNRDELVIAFLAGKSDRGTYYDAFRNRVMFPIIDTADNVIAFGGRVMDDSKPKYKNTMDTPVFKKSRNLFALNFARRTCSEYLVLCEGYMDVIAMHAAGFTNAVATLGTAITPEQARIMSRYTKKVVISYDADEPGQKATQKAIKLLEEAGLEVGVIKTPDAKDPDEYIKTYGKEKFEEIISASKSKFEYNMEAILQKHDLNLPQDRINALSELEKMISTIYSKAERDIYILHISKMFDVQRESIAADVDRLVAKRMREFRIEESRKNQQEINGFTDRVNPDYAKAPAVAAAEESVLGMLLLYSEYVKFVIENKLLNEDDFFTALGKRIFSYLSDTYHSEDARSEDYNQYFTPEEIGRLTKMKLARMGLEDNSIEVLKESIVALKNLLQKNSAQSVSTMDGLADLLGKLRNNN